MATVMPAVGKSYELAPADGKTFTMQELQKLVGGYFQALRVEDGRWMYCNEDGKALKLPRNEEATALMRGRIASRDYLVGTVVVCSPLEAGASD